MNISSVVIPVYKNESNIVALLSALNKMNQHVRNNLEVVFVVDGSPDKSYELLLSKLPECEFSSNLILLSKNFGAFYAIRAGLEAAKGEHIAVMSADLQEPPELIEEFFEILKDDCYDVLVGVRQGRNDPLLSKISSKIYWFMYKKFIMKDIPVNGVDIFAFNREFCRNLLQLREHRTSLVGQIYWLGFRRKEVRYIRKKRLQGKSAWTFSKKVNYMTDSIYSFSDLPIRVLKYVGVIGVLLFGALGGWIFIAKFFGYIDVPGYASTFLMAGFFGAINLYGIGIVGSYAWRAYENTKQRPLNIVSKKISFSKSVDE